MLNVHCKDCVFFYPTEDSSGSGFCQAHPVRVLVSAQYGCGEWLPSGLDYCRHRAARPAPVPVPGIAAIISAPLSLPDGAWHGFFRAASASLGSSAAPFGRFYDLACASSPDVLDACSPTFARSKYQLRVDMQARANRNIGGLCLRINRNTHTKTNEYRIEKV